MGEGNFSLMDSLRGLVRRGRNESQPKESAQAETLLGNENFSRNREADARLKKTVINPDAVAEGRPEVPLVGADESVVSFAGTPEQFVAFISQAQSNAVREVTKQPPVVDNISRIDMKRTGIEIIRPFGPSKSASYLRPADPESTPMRMEVVGANVVDGQLELHLLYPPTITMRVPTMSESKKVAGPGAEETITDVRNLYDRASRGELSAVQLAVEHPLMSNRMRWDALFGLDDGSVISQFRVDRGQGSRRSPGNYLTIEKRRPDLSQRIGSRSSGQVGILNIPVSDTAKLQNVFQEIIVPEKAARNLRVPATSPPSSAK